MTDRTRELPGPAVPLMLSVGGHVLALIGFVLLMRAAEPPPLPPAYAVELIAAPAGERALGATETTSSPATPDPAPPVAPERDPSNEEGLPAPTPKPVSRATPASKPATPAPARPAANAKPSDVRTPGDRPAGGGPTGDRGRDVVSVRTSGIAFPFPGYLENITRQIALNFKPKAPGIALRAEVAFLIRRDGSVSDLRLTSRSGTYGFDLECLGAVEAVGERGGFGPLPRGFSDDVLPVVFSFDPRVLK
jgi:periplasmic protein TonB